MQYPEFQCLSQFIFFDQNREITDPIFIFTQYIFTRSNGPIDPGRFRIQQTGRIVPTEIHGCFDV